MGSSPTFGISSQRALLEAVTRPADRELRVLASPDLQRPKDRQLQSQIGRLAACDEHLALIVTDVSGLQEELNRLRAEAEALSRLVSEQAAALAEKESALALLETERRESRKTGRRRAGGAERGGGPAWRARG